MRILVVIAGVIAVAIALRWLCSFFGQSVTIMDGRCGLLYSRGKFSEILAPGKYWLWRPILAQTVVIDDLRLRSIVLTGQEIVTKDQVGLKVSLVAHFSVKDPVKAHHEVENYSAHLHQSLQLALREAFSTMSLDEILGAKASVSQKLMESVPQQLAPYGIEVQGAAIRDVILPAEVRTILSKSLEAEKAAKSSLITSREELAATRCQVNTAALIKDHPEIMSLKELQVISEFAKKSGNTLVLTPSSGSLSFIRAQETKSGNKE